MKSLTIAIASYQRKDDLVRLVRALNQLAQASPRSWAGVDVVVVLDGSTDGSEEALDGLRGELPVSVIWQENSGLAAARNAGLRAATGEIVWFLDDDLVPLPGVIELHRAAHEVNEQVMLLGPCHLAPEIELFDLARQYWERQTELRSQSDRITRFDLISVANSSLPASLMRSVGGLDEQFVGYGLEDYEFGLRLLRAGTIVRFEPDAACWHYSVVDQHLSRLRRREEGRNMVRFLRMHPEVAGTYLPSTYPSRSMRVLDRLGVRSPTALAAISKLAAFAADPIIRLSGRGQEVRALSYDASYAAGVADLDRSLLPRVLGRPA
jgi:GT2 family glycosyltransferase